jgi:CheY-like chemotaxis protein
MNSQFPYPTGGRSLGEARRPLCNETFRRLDGDERTWRTSDQHFEHGARSQPMILIAGDDEAGLVMLSTLLQSKGHQVVEAKCGSEVIEMALRYTPELIFVDLHLPGTIDLNVTSYLRQSNPKSTIVAVSEVDPATCGKLALAAAGCDDYLQKPIDLQHLDRILETYV